MPTLDQIKADRHIKALVFGKFKTGKTAGAGTFPRSLFFEFDSGGANTLINPVLESKYHYSKNVVFVENFAETDKTKGGTVKMPKAFDDSCRAFDLWMGKDKVDTFDTIVVDSVTTLSEVARNKGVYLMSDSKNLGMKSETYKASLQHGLVIPKQQDYLAERSAVEQFVDMVLSIDKNVIFICHEKEIWDDAGDSVQEIVPLLTGQSVERVPLKFDEVWNLRVKKKGPETVRVLQTMPDSVRRCGSRLGLPDETPWEYEAIKKALNL